MADITNLHMALRFQAERPADHHGAALAALRVSIAAETDAGRLPAQRIALAYREWGRLRAISINDMPPSTDHVALLLDTIAFKIGATSRAEAWRHIGVNPNRGRDLLARNAQAVDWPIWFTLRHAALGDCA